MRAPGVSLLRLAPHEAEGYTALLLARSESPGGESFETLLAHCKRRRIEQQFPLVGDLDALDWKPELDILPGINFIPDAFGLSARFTLQ